MVIPSLGNWRLRGLFDISPLCLAAPCSVGQRLPLLGFWELTCSCSSKVTLWNVLFSSWDVAIYNLVLTLFFSSFILVIPNMSTSFSLSFVLSLPPFPLSYLSVSPLPGGGVGAAKVAGSKVIPALPESGQSESELSEVEGGAQATGNQLLFTAKARLGCSRGPMG